jgi:hypothetical protein
MAAFAVFKMAKVELSIDREVPERYVKSGMPAKKQEPGAIALRT